MKTTLALATLLFAGCAELGADSRRQGHTLPGHARPVLAHDWPDPDRLSFDDGGFRAIDPASAAFTTSTGVRGYVIADAADPLVRVTVALPLGRRMEHAPGAAAVAADALRRTLVDELGDGFVGDISGTTQADAATLTVETFAEDWRHVVAAVAASVREPGLGSGELRNGEDAADGVAGALARLSRLVARYPVAPPSAGSAIDAAAVQRTVRDAANPHSIVIGVAGGVPRAEVEAAVAAAFSGWVAVTPQSAAPAIEPGVPLPAPLHTFDAAGELSWVLIGQVTPAIERGDEAVVAVLEEIINIRLNIVTREMRGLTNRALLVLPEPADGAGLAYVRTSGRAESVAPLIRYSVEEIGRIREGAGAPTAEELDQAKGGLVRGQWQRSLDGPRETVTTYAVERARSGSLDALLGWPAAVDAVTADAVVAAARKYLDPAALTAVVVGPIDAVRAARHPRWPAALDDMPRLLR